MKNYGLTSYFAALGLGMALFLTAVAWFVYDNPPAGPEQFIEPAIAQPEPWPGEGCASAAVYEFSGFGADYVPQRPELPPREKIQLPTFPGCELEADYEERVFCSFGKFVAFLRANVRYPDSKREGVVIVSFTVDKDSGRVLDPRVERTIGREYSAEALRVIRLMQERDIRWTPGRIKGEPACIRIGAPFIFKLDAAPDRG